MRSGSRFDAVRDMADEQNVTDEQLTYIASMVERMAVRLSKRVWSAA
mgnify:CR=1 FL=1